VNSKLKSFIRSFLPKAVTKHRIMGGSSKGFYIVSSWFDYPAAILGRTERYLLNWFSKNVKKGDTWLDVGSHYGYTAIALSRLVGEEGRVFAFEPMLSTAGFLSQTRKINNFPQLKIIPFALGSPEYISFLSLPTTRGMVDSTYKDSTWIESILVARLDWLWELICSGDERIDGIKIDVQGMEIDVIKGMANLLTKFKPKLVVELHQGVDRKSFLNFVDSSGYSLDATPIEPLNGEIKPKFFDNKSYAFVPKELVNI
jgi:FkbM family methyltransferase